MSSFSTNAGVNLKVEKGEFAMKEVSINGYTTDTVDSITDPQAISLNGIAEGIVGQHNGKISKFEMSKGVGNFQVEGDEAIQALSDEFGKLDGVTVSVHSLLEAQLLKNRVKQQKVNRMRETRKKNTAKKTQG